MGIEFNNTASEETVPNSEEVADTLVTAVSNTSNNFNLTIDSSSVKVVGKQILHIHFTFYNCEI